MGGDCKYEIGQNPYVKIILHALKHRNSAVNSLLIGRLLDDETTVCITDAVPLSHSQIGLLPALELALIQVSYIFLSSFDFPLVGSGSQKFWDLCTDFDFGNEFIVIYRYIGGRTL